MSKYDIILLHAPSVYDFRNRDDVLFAYLSNSDSVAVSPIYEMFPLGFKAIESYLRGKGKQVKIVNLAGMMLKDSSLNVDQVLGSLETCMFGIDLHWLAHAQGALAVAAKVKQIHPAIPVLMGGVSASLFHAELIQYPQVDYILRGVETTRQVARLLDQITATAHHDIPNLCWKDKHGTVHVNPSEETREYNAAVDWRQEDATINYFMSFSGAGCEHNCLLCGGSKYTMNKLLNVKDGFAPKDRELFLAEIEGLKRYTVKNKRLVALHHWFENYEYLTQGIASIESCDIHTVHFTLHHLLPRKHLEAISRSRMRPLFEISIDSHVEEIRKATGKGLYTNAELEAWLDELFVLNKRALVEIYLMIGMPRQTRSIVEDEVRFAGHLLKKYSKKNLNVYLTPMRPFLDHGSYIFDNAERFGYKILFDSLKEYEKALVVPHWKNSLNYETAWLSRSDLVESTYASSKAMIEQRIATNKLPKAIGRMMNDKIDGTVALLGEIEHYEQEPLPGDLRGKIRAYNAEVLDSSASQQSPFSKGLYKNWYDC